MANALTLVFRHQAGAQAPLPILVTHPSPGAPEGPSFFATAEAAAADLTLLTELPHDLRALLWTAWEEVVGSPPSVFDEGMAVAGHAFLSADMWLEIVIWFVHALCPAQPARMTWDRRAGPGTPRSGIPRAFWNVGASLFFPPGVGLRWHTNMTTQGLLKYQRCYSYGMPTGVLERGLRDKVLVHTILPMLGLKFKRTKITCPRPVTGWQQELPVPFTRGMPKSELCTTWLVDRLLNGMAPAALVVVGNGEFEARMSFRDLDVVEVATMRAKPYVLPDVAVRIGLDAQGKVELRGFRVAYRGADGVYGAPIVVSPTDPEWLRFRAARVAACAYFLSGQFDQHIARGHLVPEAVAVALDVAGLDADHPVRQLLAPRVAEIPGVNLAADGGIWGPDGVLSMCTPLGTDALSKRMRDRLAGLDWKGYAPPSRRIGVGHDAPERLSAYWAQVVIPYVTDALARLGGGFIQWWAANPRWKAQMIALFDALNQAPLAFKPWDGGVSFDPAGVWFDGAEFSVGRAPGNTWSPLDPNAPLADLIQLCAFAIYHSTLGHTWANVRQTTDAGDPDFALICLAQRLDAPPPADPADDSAWHAAAAPSPCDLAYQRAAANTLTNVVVDVFDDELQGRASTDIPPDPLGQPPHNAPALMLAARTRAWVQTWSTLSTLSTYPDRLTSDLTKHLSRGNR